MKEMALADFVRCLAYLALTTAWGKELLAAAAELLARVFSFLAIELSAQAQQKKASVSVTSQKPSIAQFQNNVSQDEMKFNKTHGMSTIPVGWVSMELRNVSVGTLLLTLPTSLTGILSASQNGTSGGARRFGEGISRRCRLKKSTKRHRRNR